MGERLKEKERKRKLNSPHFIHTSGSTPNPKDMVLWVSETMPPKWFCRIYLEKVPVFKWHVQPKPEEYQQHLGLQTAGLKFLQWAAGGTRLPSQRMRPDLRNPTGWAWAFAPLCWRSCAHTQRQLQGNTAGLGTSACPAAPTEVQKRNQSTDRAISQRTAFLFWHIPVAVGGRSKQNDGAVS